jgi:hypothetical protein
MNMITDYGNPMKPFFIENQNFWAWAEKFLGIAFGVFSAKLSAPYWYCESLVHFFHYSTIISTKN